MQSAFVLMVSYLPYTMHMHGSIGNILKKKDGITCTTKIYKAVTLLGDISRILLLEYQATVTTCTARRRVL